jgi:hypothetical protein
MVQMAVVSDFLAALNVSQAREKLYDRWSILVLSVERVFHCGGDD